MIPAIISPDMIRVSARAAFAAGEPLESCAMNRQSAAYQTWAAEYARLETEAAMLAAMRDERSTPAVQSAPAARKQVDVAQLFAQLELDGQRMVVELIETLIVLQEQLR
jgi:uroporphyrinogen-III decarboxylase